MPLRILNCGATNEESASAGRWKPHSQFVFLALNSKADRSSRTSPVPYS
jgi:hypothetical protein